MPVATRLPRVFTLRMALALLLVCSLCSVTVAQEWTRFHGPNGQGHSEGVTVPAKWTSGDYAWTANLPGIGNSSPTLWGKLLFVMSANPDDATRYLLCFDADSGKELWRKSYASRPHHLHNRNSYASCTPACDAERVYFAWSSDDETTLVALDHSGEQLWEKSLGPWVSQHGFGTSPAVYDGVVYLNANQEGEQLPAGVEPGTSFLYAFDAAKGTELWRLPCESSKLSYSVPCVVTNAGGKKELVCTSTSEGMFAVDPKTGEMIWNLDVFEQRTVSSPIAAGGMLFGSTGSGGGGNYLVAIKPGASPEEAYRVKGLVPYVPTSVADDELMYLFNDKGIVSAMELKTGEIVWQERIGGEFSGSPILLGDRILMVNDAGEALVLKAGREFELLGKTSLGQPTRATPAVANGMIFLRTDSKLLCLPGEKT